MKKSSASEINNASMQIKRILLVFMILLFSGAALAQEPVKGKNKKNGKLPQATLKEAKVTAGILTTIKEVEPMKMRLNVLNPGEKTVRIGIRNAWNEPFYAHSFRDREYNKVLNFNSTPADRYSLHIANPKQAETHWFKIESNDKRIMSQGALNRQSASDVMASIFMSSPTSIRLHLANATGKPVAYRLSNEANEVLYKGNVRDAQFIKGFDLAQARTGKYTLEVTNQAGEVASRTFDLQTMTERSFTWTNKRGRPLKPAAIALKMARLNQ